MSRRAPQFAATAALLLMSLAETELQTGRRLHEDPLNYSHEIGPRSYCTYYSIKGQ